MVCDGALFGYECFRSTDRNQSLGRIWVRICFKLNILNVRRTRARFRHLKSRIGLSLPSSLGTRKYRLQKPDSLFAKGTISTAPFASRVDSEKMRFIVLHQILYNTSEYRWPVSELEGLASFYGS